MGGTECHIKTQAPLSSQRNHKIWPHCPTAVTLDFRVVAPVHGRVLSHLLHTPPDLPHSLITYLATGDIRVSDPRY